MARESLFSQPTHVKPSTFRMICSVGTWPNSMSLAVQLYARVVSLTFERSGFEVSSVEQQESALLFSVHVAEDFLTAHPREPSEDCFS